MQRLMTNTGKQPDVFHPTTLASRYYPTFTSTVVSVFLIPGTVNLKYPPTSAACLTSAQCHLGFSDALGNLSYRSHSWPQHHSTSTSSLHHYVIPFPAQSLKLWRTRPLRGYSRWYQLQPGGEKKLVFSAGVAVKGDHFLRSAVYPDVDAVERLRYNFE